MSGAFNFESLWVLWLVPLPLLVYLFFPRAPSSSAALRVPFFHQLGALQFGVVKTGYTRIALLLLCWILMMLAAARPQWIGENTSLPVSGRDLMLAVDISGSMKARDMEYKSRPQDRLSAVKRVAGDFIERRTGDRIGLILFGTRAYLQAPLSLDRVTVNQLLQESAIGLAGEKTAIGDAIGLAVKRLNERPGNERLLVLLTDGANTSGETDPLEAAQLASLAGLRIHTIGFGADASGQRSIFGSSLFSRRNAVDIETLREVAAITKGKFFRATDVDSLENIYRLIDELEPVDEDLQNLKPVHELFYLPLGGVLLITMLAVVLSLFRTLGLLRAAKVSLSPGIFNSDPG